MTGPIALTLAILGVAVVLFVTDRLRVDIVALLVLLALVITGLITPADAFSGFSSPAVITVWAVFIISGGLFHTGVANLMARPLQRLAGNHPSRLIALLMGAVSGLSFFMNNVGATAVLLPAAVSASRQTRVNASRLLMPLAFGSFLGGMATLIGTPSNLLASDALRQAGLRPFSFFEFLPIGLAAVVLGIGYMSLLGYRLLPDRTPAERLAPVAGPDVDLMGLYQLGERLFRTRIPATSPLIGRTLAESGLRQQFELSVVGLERRGTRTLPDKDTVLRRGDVLLIEARTENLARAEAAGLLDPQPEVGAQDLELQSEAVGMVEAIVSPHSQWDGKTLGDVQFREKFHLTVLAIFRDGYPKRTGLADLPLRFGDSLLVQGPRQYLQMLQREAGFVVVGGPEAALTVRAKKAPLAAGLLLVLIVPAVAGWLPISASALLAAVLMVILGCLTMDEAYQSIEWRAVFLVAGTLPLGIALQKTGAAQFLADLLVHSVGSLGPLALLASFYVLTNLLTQFVANAATVVLIAPIAIGVAQHLGKDPHALLMTVAIAASATFLTPVAHQANVLVMGPGGYRFGDYFKAGLPLDLLVMGVVLLMVPLLWPWL